jgi:HAE1 family hydrophobic/amphiphilic exporter-1
MVEEGRLVMNKLAALFTCLLLLLAHPARTHAQGRFYTIQVASAPTEAEAQTLVAELAAAGLQAHWVRADVPGLGARYRVRFGRFATQTEAKAIAAQTLQRKAIKEYIVTFADSPARLSRASTENKAEQPKPAPAVAAQKTNADAPLPNGKTNPAAQAEALPQAQTQPQTGALPPVARPLPQRSAGLEAGRIVRWTLRDALLAALANNVEIELERANVRLAQFDVLAAESVYDRASTASVSYDAQTQANTRLFSGTNADTTNSRSLSYNFGLQQLLQRGGGSYQLSFDNQRNSNNFSTLSPQYNPRLSFALRQPLLRNFKVDAFRRQIKIAKKRQDLSDAVFRQRVIETVAQAQQAYWNLALALKQEEVLRDSVKLAEEQLRHNQRQVELGTQSELEVVQSASALETRRQQVFQAMATVVQAENALKSLTAGAPGAELWRAQILPVESFDPRPLSLPLDDALKLAREHRPELKQLVLQQESNRIDQDYFRNQLKPQIDLVGGYALIGIAGVKNSGLVTVPPTCITTNPPDTPGCIPPAFLGGYPAALTNLFRNDFKSWQVGLNISFPWRNRVSKANLGRAQAQERQLDLQTRRTLQNIELEVRTAVQTIETIKLRSEAARAASEYARQQLKGEEKKFQAGLSTTFLVLQRQTDLSQARAAELSALADYNKAVAELQRVISATLTDNNIEIKPAIQPAAK